MKVGIIQSYFKLHIFCEMISAFIIDSAVDSAFESGIFTAK